MLILTNFRSKVFRSIGAIALLLNGCQTSSTPIRKHFYPAFSSQPPRQDNDIFSASKATVAVGQMTSTNDRDHNFKICRELADAAAKRGAKLLCLPECFHFIGFSTRETIEAAEMIEEGPSIKRYCKLARQYGLWLSLGGFQELIPQSEGAEKKIYNSHIIIDNLGKIVKTYRKLHMFDVQVPNGPMLMESRFTEAGKEIALVSTPFGKLGLSTCYDVRFPDMYMELASKGAEIILVPSAFTVFTGRSHWEILLRARAIETQCYVLAAAQVGKHHNNRASYGHSLIIDPWGGIMAGAGGEEKDSPKLVTAEIDLDYLRSVRTNLPVQTHRRTDVY
mmetsp:Transcript_1410/g.1919  ORF Transcript_1410/g.1919 Transcript_1410/m.1919 type:complete len:335 (+) Transcript_1410:254-1258(+)|eukprot:CAMPEP_0117753740 /NCGR_PEP_ID=MMETSP0947-20121206/12413_1 /TAXON_ID=44440 /ORGANISM="Chattonella subsalsa, Strain CCMP2191" /LENGTH=334 /DNA_ID=CAMNT_0005572695 /DNA_START=166 /DNA_END=1170 /DNA_ORIENTATION=+